ncbi:MAG: AAA family ATPase [Saprospiraceae bacterium]|nr:AAA family ATPase [Saprospiraceae bacterium]
MRVPLPESQFKPLELSPDFKYALDEMEKGQKNLFVTGRAGTGKSTLLQLFRNTTRKKVVVLAPTGIAALNVRGQTIHSFFKLPPKVIQKDDIHKVRNRSIYQKVETIVIDEISMVRADLMDAIDRFLRVNRENEAPFGGVQMIFFGDLFQLPPVVSRQVEKQFFQTYYSSPYFFSAKILEAGFPVEMIELTKVYRQDERAFIRLLDAIRLRSIDYDDLAELNLRYKPDFKSEFPYITLCSVNALANKINLSRLRELDTTAFNYQATVTGDFNMKLFPTEQFLSLKEGAQVMLLRNDAQRRYVNGSIATIMSLGPDQIDLRIHGRDGSTEDITLEQTEWEMIKYAFADRQKGKLEARVTGTFRQYPLKLAWAITIHKSQGKTFDRVIIDLGRGAFEFGQTYVALSRCRTLDGIVLKRPIKYSDIMVDPRILDFYDLQRRYLPGG